MRPTVGPNVRVSNDFSIDHLLIHDADVHRYTKVRLPGGSFKEEWNLVASIACRFTTYSSRFNRVEAMQQETFGTQFKVFARGDADIKADDRIVYGGKTYEVVDTPLDPSFIGHHLEVEVKLVPKVV